jgi:predicted hydrolase (HD superfamily)
MNQPTTGSLLEQLRATHVGHRSLADVSVAVEAGARALARRWDELAHEERAAIIAMVGPVVEAALAALDQSHDPQAEG